MPSLPTAGVPVELRVLLSPRWLDGSVIDSNNVGLVVHAPGGADLLVRSGDHVAVRWREDGFGLGLVDTAVAGRARETGVATWLLRAAGPTTVVQRRRHLRVPVTLPAQAAWPSGERHLLTLDLAEGGVRCIARGGVDLEPGEPVSLTVDLDSGPVVGEAQVLRRTESPGGTMLVFRFLGLPRRDADRVRRFVFARDVELAGLAR